MLGHPTIFAASHGPQSSFLPGIAALATEGPGRWSVDVPLIVAGQVMPEAPEGNTGVDGGNSDKGP